MKKWFSFLCFLVGAFLVFASFAPVFATVGTLKQIDAKALSDHGCVPDDEWHFVINQVYPDVVTSAPSSIHVIWANGASADIPRDTSNPAQNVAHYNTTANLDSTVTSATAQIYATWDGEFNLSHGPCEETPTPTDEPTDEPTDDPTETLTPTNTSQPTSTPKPQVTGVGGESFPVAGVGYGLMGLGLMIAMWPKKKK